MGRTMPKSSAFRIRFALVGILSVLALGFLLPPSFAQPGRPRPPAPRPPTFRPPTVPQPPTMPQPPRVPPVQPFRPPIMPGTVTVSEWYCTGCKAVLGRGPIKPALASCPQCGARFSNGSPGPDGFANIPSRPTEPGGPAAPPLPTNPAFINANASSEPAAGATPDDQPREESNPIASPSSEDNPVPSDRPASSKNGSRAIVIVGIVVGALFALGAMTMLIMIVVKASATKPTRRKRRKEQDDDD